MRFVDPRLELGVQSGLRMLHDTDKGTLAARLEVHPSWWRWTASWWVRFHHLHCSLNGDDITYIQAVCPDDMSHVLAVLLLLYNTADT